MDGNGAQPFANNWAYLKTELRWLDRLLMLAVSRQRREDKAVNRVAQTTADRVTSHWWKGIIAIDGGIQDSSPYKPPTPMTSGSYGEQLEAKIQISQQRGIVLALPALRDRFGLTVFEKNMILLAIAPEINRRYGRLYDFLQNETGELEDLPTVDLCLRLLCANDQAWQQGRSRLIAEDSLMAYGILESIGDDGTLLSQQVKVVEPLVNYLLSEHPDAATLEALLSQEDLDDAPEDAAASPPAPQDDRSPDGSSPLPSPPGANTLILQSVSHTVEAAWEHLILPKTLRHRLQYLGRQAGQRQGNGIPGLMVLLAGAAGTGKTMAAGAIAADLDQSFTCLNLAAIAPEQAIAALLDLPMELDSLLLLQRGECWFGRGGTVRDWDLHHWWQRQQQTHGLTLVSVRHLASIRPFWRQRFDVILLFPKPDKNARLQLWQQAFPPDIQTDALDWGQVAQQWALTGGEIQAIAQAALLELRATGKTTLALKHLREAASLRYPALDVRAIRSSPS
jgi:hypothetical protein